MKFVFLSLIYFLNIDTEELHESTTLVKDVVTPCDEMPEWLWKDPLSNSYVFCLGRYDFETKVLNSPFADKKIVKKMNWDQLNKATAKMVGEIYLDLSKYYQNGLSSSFRHTLCAVLASKLPFVERKYLKIRKQASENPNLTFLSKTVESLISFEVRNLI